jgi:uncharacterized membrane protein
MSSVILPLLGAAAGGAAMYLLDPDRGRRRRALLRDQAVKRSHELREAVEVGARDLKHRGLGVAARARSMLRRRNAPDDVVAERVRARMGHGVGHPGAVDVSVREGEVTLSGAVLQHEHEGLLTEVRAVPGVRGLVDRLAVHATSEGVSALQGTPRQPNPAFRHAWAPGIRLAAGVAGGTLALYALKSGGPTGLALGAAGALMLVRSGANRPLAELAGMTPSGAIHVQKSLAIDAPVEEVFDLLANPVNFPRFMRNVRAVETREEGLYRWTVAGPAATSIEWDAETTAMQANECIAWRTLPGSAVEHEGTIRLEPYRDGTRLHIALSYCPPAGALGHVVAKLFGADPKSEMDEDLMRLKSELEAGNTPRRESAPPPREKTETAALLTP